MDLKEQLKKAAEELLENLVNNNSDPLLEKACQQLAAAIPGTFDDVAIEALKPTIKNIVKSYLLAAVEKISDQT